MTVQIREDGIELKIYKQHQTTSGALLNKLPHVNHPHKPHQEAASTTKWRCPPVEHVSTHVLLLRFKALTLETSRHKRPILRPWGDTGQDGSFGQTYEWGIMKDEVQRWNTKYIKIPILSDLAKNQDNDELYSQHPLDKTNWTVLVICRDRVLG